jgi:hypothetical protein
LEGIRNVIASTALVQKSEKEAWRVVERFKPVIWTIAAVIAGTVLSACGESSSQRTSTVPEGQVSLPQLGQTYGSTDRNLAAYKWSNSDQTQETNLYQIPNDTQPFMLHITYGLLPSGGKRVSMIHYYGGSDFPGSFTNAVWARVKKTTIPPDAVIVPLSSIGGKLEEVNSEPPPPGTTTTVFYSASLAKQERKWGVPTCEEASSKHGLIFVDRNMSGGDLDADITDAAIYYCGEHL